MNELFPKTVYLHYCDMLVSFDLNAVRHVLSHSFGKVLALTDTVLEGE